MDSNNSKYRVYTGFGDINLPGMTYGKVRDINKTQLDIRGFRIPNNIKDRFKLKDKGEVKFQSEDDC
jgi:hypothetical protein